MRPISDRCTRCFSSITPKYLTKIRSSHTLPTTPIKIADTRFAGERAYAMVTHDGHHYEQTQQECFLRALDPNAPCAVPQLKGHIIYAHEVKVDGEMTPFITIDLGTEYPSYSLPPHYPRLLKSSNDSRLHSPTPTPPRCANPLPP